MPKAVEDAGRTKIGEGPSLFAERACALTGPRSGPPLTFGNRNQTPAKRGVSEALL